jgi:uncharacterized protein
MTTGPPPLASSDVTGNLYAGGMLMLLPPSEGKSTPTRGAALRPTELGFPELIEPRRQVLEALVAHCVADPRQAAENLGLGPSQTELVTRNAQLRTAPTARADQIYTGVLYQALDLASMPASARRRAASNIVVTSALFGVIRPHDRIPPYRLSGTTTLPGLGPVATHWRGHLAKSISASLGQGLLLDLRSAAYAGFWRPPTAIADRTVAVRVQHERRGVRRTVSHFNKATKGALVRDLLASGQSPTTPAGLMLLVRDLGWHAELTEPTRVGSILDVIVTELTGSQQ